MSRLSSIFIRTPSTPTTDLTSYRKNWLFLEWLPLPTVVQKMRRSELPQNSRDCAVTDAHLHLDFVPGPCPASAGLLVSTRPPWRAGQRRASPSLPPSRHPVATLAAAKGPGLGSAVELPADGCALRTPTTLIRERL